MQKENRLKCPLCQKPLDTTTYLEDGKMRGLCSECDLVIYTMPYSSLRKYRIEWMRKYNERNFNPSKRKNLKIGFRRAQVRKIK